MIHRRLLEVAEVDEECMVSPYWTTSHFRVSTNPDYPISRRFPGDIQDTFFFKSRRFSRDKSYNIKMQVKFVVSQDILFFEF